MGEVIKALGHHSDQEIVLEDTYLYTAIRAPYFTIDELAEIRLAEEAKTY